MLIPFTKIALKYGSPKGIIHIGAHLAEERNDYQLFKLNNTIWVEGNPEVFDVLKTIITPPETAFNLLASDVDDKEVQFNITNNGQSSSILELGKHTVYHPHVYVEKIISAKTTRMDTFFTNNNIDISNYDFINLDIQGAELSALKGFGQALHNFKFIYTEINMGYVYKDCCLVWEIDDYLKEFNFTRVETEVTDFEWGDALYVK